MDDPHTPGAIIAQALQHTFPTKGKWQNWMPLADHILTRLTEAGFGVVPTRLQDRRIAGQGSDAAWVADVMERLTVSPPSAKVITLVADRRPTGAS